MLSKHQNSLLTEEFPLDEEICYLNHAAVAPWPQKTAEAVIQFAEENRRFGAKNYPKWMAIETQLRQKLKTLIGAQSVDEIALTKSTSEALSFVAYGISWHPGDEVILCDQEFPSNRIVWESLKEKFGVRTVIVNITDSDSPEQAILSAITPRTRLVTVSSVQYGTGLKLKTQLLGQELKPRNILFCVDAIQSLGVCPIDVQKDGIDFLMADGHKWLLGPEGLAVFYIRQNCLNTLSLNEYGWHMIKDRGDYSKKTWEIADDATRFECGSPNMIAIHALNASLGLILDIGLRTIEEAVAEHLEYLRLRLQSIPGIELITKMDKDRTAGILTFTINHGDVESVQKSLVKKGVICAYRGGGIRFSPHFYTSRKVLDRAIASLISCMGNN